MKKRKLIRFVFQNKLMREKPKNKFEFVNFKSKIVLFLKMKK